MIEKDEGQSYRGFYDNKLDDGCGDAISMGLYFLNEKLEANCRFLGREVDLVLSNKQTKEIYKIMKAHFEADLLE